MVAAQPPSACPIEAGGLPPPGTSKDARPPPPPPPPPAAQTGAGARFWARAQRAPRVAPARAAGAEAITGTGARLCVRAEQRPQRDLVARPDVRRPSAYQ